MAPRREGLSFFAKVTLAGVVLVGGAVGAMILFSSGDEAQIKAMLTEGQAALDRHDAEACVGFLWPSYDHNNVDYDRICGQIRAYVAPGQYKKAELLEPQIDIVGDLATVKLKIKVSGGTLPYNVARPLHFSLRRVDGRWWIDGIDAPDPLTR